MENNKKIIMVIIGTLIGAGFASGKEIYVFFFKFGKYGILGIIFSVIITGLIIFFTLKIAIKNEIEYYDEFVETINKKHKIINKIIKFVVTAFLLFTFFIMIAGFSAYIKQMYKIETYISSTAFVTIVYFILRKSTQGMLKFNNFLVPIIIFFMIYLGIKNIPFIISKPNISIDIEAKYWFIYSALYASYNSIILIPVLITLKNYLVTEKEIKMISVVSSEIMIILALCVFGILLKANFNIENIEMPILELLENSFFKTAYGVIIIISIFTSAISIGHSFLENTSNDKKYRRNLIIICIFGVFVSNIGFSNLVGTLYPIFGILGFIQIFYIYKNALEKKGKKCYKLCNKKSGRIK